ncbi:MAG: hypothetical protein QW420_01840 [Candidatus Caldarchaeum sp.]
MSVKHYPVSPALAVLPLSFPFNYVAQQASKRVVSGFKCIMWGTADVDVCYSVAIDEAGSIHIAGVTGKFPFIYPFIAKLSSDGSLLWNGKIMIPGCGEAFTPSVAVGPDNLSITTILLACGSSLALALEMLQSSSG